jgi:hypothetical protein
VREIVCERCLERRPRHWQNCIFADCERAPKPREPQLSTEERYALDMRALELKHAKEARERREVEAKAEFERAKTLAQLDEDRKLWRQYKLREIATAAEQLRGKVADEQEYQRGQARARRLDRNLQSREGRP